MPFSLEGWIEVARSPDTSAEHAWFGVVDLSSIVDVGDEDSKRLFGLSKDGVSGQKEIAPLAAGRGVPANPSEQLRRALDDIAAYEAKFGSGEMGGYTYALWAEIRDHALAVPPNKSQWALPFAIARILGDRFGADRVRFVIWFNW
jgi:hypothetical protein